MKVPSIRVLYLAAAAALAWRVWVGVGQLSDPTPLPLALVGVGLTYLVCGLAVVGRAPLAATSLFAVHCFSQALHWGGPIRAGSTTVDMLLLFVYFVISMLGTSAVLHFTLLYPGPLKLARNRATALVLYGPVALAAAIAVVWLGMPADSAGKESVRDVFFIVEAVQVNLYFLAALASLAIRFVKTEKEERKRAGLGVMLAWGLASILPYAVSVTLPLPEEIPTQWFTVFFALMPIAFAWVIVRGHRE